jgi:hypothetical protein
VIAYSLSKFAMSQPPSRNIRIQALIAFGRISRELTVQYIRS